jgi:hypothetical protein
LKDNTLDKIHRQKIAAPTKDGSKSRGQLIFDFQSFLVLSLAQVVPAKFYLAQFDEDSAW